jgi:hypothetical protein
VTQAQLPKIKMASFGSVQSFQGPTSAGILNDPPVSGVVEGAHPAKLPIVFADLGAPAATITGTQLGPDSFLVQTPGGAINDTTPTAGLLFAALNGRVALGSTWRVTILNRSAAAAAITLLAGTGCTLVGTTTIASASARDYLVTFTSRTAYSLTGLQTYLSLP